MFFSLIDSKDDLEARIQPWTSELPTSVNSDSTITTKASSKARKEEDKGLFPPVVTIMSAMLLARKERKRIRRLRKQHALRCLSRFFRSSKKLAVRSARLKMMR